MQISQAVKAFLEYHRANSEKNTVNGYHFVLCRFKREFGRRKIDGVTSEEIFSFLVSLTHTRKQSTKYSRCALTSELSSTTSLIAINSTFPTLATVPSSNGSFGHPNRTTDRNSQGDRR